jgi:NADPH-dependent curcumin reductase CurA
MNQQWVLVARPEGLPKATDFAWRETGRPEAGPGEVVVRSIYLSLDPAMRGWMARDSYVPAVELGAVMRGGAIGVVEESNHPDFGVGDRVQGMLGWQKYIVSNGKGLQRLPELGIPLEAYYGVLSHIGLTAYFGLLDS